MKVPLQQEILDVIKQRLLPEIADIKADIVQMKVDSETALTQISTEFKVVNGRLDQMDKRFDQMDQDPGSLNVPQELVTEPRSGMSSLDQAGDICHDE